MLTMPSVNFIGSVNTARNPQRHFSTIQSHIDDRQSSEAPPDSSVITREKVIKLMQHCESLSIELDNRSQIIQRYENMFLAMEEKITEQNKRIAQLYNLNQ